ncbi:MAG: acyl-CoA dehydrogenase family protein [Chloroflexota bacterium]
MDFRFTGNQESLRKEFEAFFKEEMKSAPAGWVDRTSAWSSDEGNQFHRALARKLGDRGWLSLSWPTEYGGFGYGPVEQFIFDQVRGYYLSAGWDHFSHFIMPSMLFRFGTPEQRQEHLPRSARGERFWCQAWSEPNSGSDLASLTTRAVDTDGEFVVNGQKIWTTGAHHADWMFFLARTDPEQPRHRGLSMFLTDMRVPGLTVRPLLEMGGTHEYNEVFFEDVRIPRANLVGQKNDGWTVTLACADFERSSFSVYFGETRRLLEELVQFCNSLPPGHPSSSRNPLVRHRLAQLHIEIEAATLWSLQIAWQSGRTGQLPTAMAAGAKLFGTDTLRRMARTGMQLLGLYAQLKEDSKRVLLAGKWEVLYHRAIAAAISAGSSEIQRNIVAWRGLELPRR